MNDSYQNTEFVFEENIKYHQIGNAYRQHELSVEKDVANQVDRILIDGDTFAVVNNAIAYCFKQTSFQRQVSVI